jgi:hypothetical protein
VSDVFDLADAVAGRVNAGSYTIADSFTATGLALIEFDADELVDAVQVHCTPVSKNIETLSRSKDKSLIKIGVGVLKKIGTNNGKVDTSQVDGLVELCEEIADQLKGYDPTVNGRKARWINNEIDPIYDAESLYSFQQFRSMIGATYLLTTP